MFLRNDLDELLACEARPAVSIYLPTHKAGREIRQDFDPAAASAARRRRRRGSTGAIAAAARPPRSCATEPEAHTGGPIWILPSKSFFTTCRPRPRSKRKSATASRSWTGCTTTWSGAASRSSIAPAAPDRQCLRGAYRIARAGRGCRGQPRAAPRPRALQRSGCQRGAARRVQDRRAAPDGVQAQAARRREGARGRCVLRRPGVAALPGRGSRLPADA